jgi:hypothetical protein
MKYNLKNRPKYSKEIHCQSWAFTDVEYFFDRFEKELREIIKNCSSCQSFIGRDWGLCRDHKIIKEILGDDSKEE